jgi:hypothetical protein
MTTIRTTCPTCDDREVDIPSGGILLLIGESEEEGSYSFMCPDCETIQDKPAEKRVADVLIEAGVPRG